MSYPPLPKGETASNYFPKYSKEVFVITTSGKVYKLAEDKWLPQELPKRQNEVNKDDGKLPF